MAKTLVCRCEDVTLHELEEAIERGHDDLESLKRYTGFGTGWCQGKSCVALCARLLTERGGSAVLPITPRPPFHPTRLADLAGLAAVADADAKEGRPREVTMFVPFLYELRARKVKVGAQEAMSLARALTLGLHDSSLDGFYHVARALCVHRESDLDGFDQAFSSHFRGIPAASLEMLDALEEWLRDPRNKGDLSQEEIDRLKSIDMEELRRLFEERLREQKERHDGGNRWIGTGGTSPFGAGGKNPSGVRVGPKGGGRSAMAVADARMYQPYRSDVVLDARQIEVALRKLRAFQREGALDELDIDGTIDKTAKNGGELEIVMRAPRKPNVRVLLLMDVGGSMDPYAHTVSLLFSAAKRASNIRELKTYYFHNCIYGRVYSTEGFTSPTPVRELIAQCGPEWKLVMVGDAAMHPAELLGAGDWEYYRAGKPGESMPGLRWMMLLEDHFRRTVWLNPDPPSYWRGGTAEQLGQVFPMFQLTLDGLTDAIRHLSKGDVTRK